MSAAVFGRALRLPFLAVLAVLLAACAAGAHRPLDYAAGNDLQTMVAEHGATDARFEPVRDRPWLMVDLALRYRAQDYPASAPLAARRAFVDDFLTRAEGRGREAMAGALERIPPADLADYAARHELGAGEPRERILGAYAVHAHNELEAETTRVAALDAAALDGYWSALQAAIEPSIMSRGRLARQLATAPAVPFIKGWIAYHNWHDYRGPLNADFDDAVALEPAMTVPGASAIARADWELLARYAPIVVQERKAHTEYPGAWDQFGTVGLEGMTLDTAHPSVDSAAPALYAFIERKPIQGRQTRQLVYVLWYPRHPALTRFDPEEGDLDGWTVRLTLDQHDRPLLLESVSNCGCYYKVFPSQTLEAASRAAWPERLADKQFYLEQHLEERFDAVVPEAVDGLADARRRIVLYFNAGHHQLVTVRSLDAAAVAALKPVAYTLRPYDELEELPFGDYHASLFGEDGLVRTAHRRECALLTPSGLYHAGHPRQRETQMIYFDEADFDDPGLLERYLRLPPDAFGDQV
ncbi:MAG: hypothetical protein KDK06_08075 [Gammaproteobacteria bacterium]|nr:hypothetical protein [Gammaproteobacteria bacterium]